MEPTPEERAQMETFAKTLRSHAILKHGKGLVLGGIVLFALAAFQAQGQDRFMFAMIAVFGAALMLPALVKGNPALQGWARGLQLLTGLALLLCGAALLAFGVMLFMAGSYGILASFVVIPLALVPLIFGWTLLTAGSVSETRTRLY